MITANGELHIKRYMAKYVPSIAQSVAIGIGTRAESTVDTRLDFEVGRADITLTAFDFANDQLVFKAPMPEDFGGVVNEVAIYSTSANEVAGGYGSQMITSFDSDSEIWIDPVSLAASAFSTNNTRLGNDSLRQNPAASASMTAAQQDIFLDLGGYSGADKFLLALNAENNFTSNIRVQFMTDTANYYYVDFGSQSAGYHIKEVAKAAASVQGTPDWSDISELRITTTSTAGGSAAVTLDGLRIEDEDSINTDYVMVARKVLAAPFVKQEGKIQNIEFRMEVNV